MADETVELSTLEVSSELLTPTLTYDWLQEIDALEMTSALLTPTLTYDWLQEIDALEMTSALLDLSVALGYVVSLETLTLATSLLNPTISRPVFPTLTVKPSVKKFSQTLISDPVHRARMGSGAILTRPTFSQTPDSYNVSYSLMSDADKIILETWVKDVIGNGGLRFEWTNIQNEKTYVSVLLNPIIYKIHPKSKGNYWIVDFSLATIYEIL